MKIGILTFHNAINYGAVIQCYALKEFLVQRGHDVQVIDYRNPYVEDYAKLIPLSVISAKKSLVSKLKSIVISLIVYKGKQKISKIFKTFVESRLNTSPRCHSAAEIPSDYDCIVFGSDQIWNPNLCGGFDPAFYGQFPKGRTKFVSYAASMGNVSLFSDKDWQDIYSRLTAFDHISVRELSLRQVLEQRFHFLVSNCVDPTFLVDSKILLSLAKDPGIRDYIFVYNVMNDDNSEDFADRMAMKNGLKVVIGQAKPRVRRLNKNISHILVDSLSPEEFLGYIKYANIVIGNSFHSIALSIVFRKDFYSLASNKSERIVDLLSHIGLSDRHVRSIEKHIEVESINYQEPAKKLSVLREISVQYMSDCGL